MLSVQLTVLYVKVVSLNEIKIWLPNFVETILNSLQLKVVRMSALSSAGGNRSDNLDIISRISVLGFGVIATYWWQCHEHVFMTCTLIEIGPIFWLVYRPRGKRDTDGASHAMSAVPEVGINEKDK